MKITLKQIGYKLFHCSPGEFPVGEHQNLLGVGGTKCFYAGQTLLPILAHSKYSQKIVNTRSKSQWSNFSKPLQAYLLD